MKLFITRDKDGTLGMFNNEPHYTEAEECWGVEVDEDMFVAELHDDLFPDLKYSDLPLEVDIDLDKVRYTVFDID